APAGRALRQRVHHLLRGHAPPPPEPARPPVAGPARALAPLLRLEARHAARRAVPQPALQLADARLERCHRRLELAHVGGPVVRTCGRGSNNAQTLPDSLSRRPPAQTRPLESDLLPPSGAIDRREGGG